RQQPQLRPGEYSDRHRARPAQAQAGGRHRLPRPNHHASHPACQPRILPVLGHRRVAQSRPQFLRLTSPAVAGSRLAQQTPNPSGPAAPPKASNSSSQPSSTQPGPNEASAGKDQPAAPASVTSKVPTSAPILKKSQLLKNPAAFADQVLNS